MDKHKTPKMFDKKKDSFRGKKFNISWGKKLSFLHRVGGGGIIVENIHSWVFFSSFLILVTQIIFIFHNSGNKTLKTFRPPHNRT